MSSQGHCTPSYSPGWLADGTQLGPFPGIILAAGVALPKVMLPPMQPSANFWSVCKGLAAFHQKRSNSQLASWALAPCRVRHGCGTTALQFRFSFYPDQHPSGLKRVLPSSALTHTSPCFRAQFQEASLQQWTCLELTFLSFDLAAFWRGTHLMCHEEKQSELMKMDLSIYC